MKSGMKSSLMGRGSRGEIFLGGGGDSLNKTKKI